MQNHTELQNRDANYLRYRGMMLVFVASAVVVVMLIVVMVRWFLRLDILLAGGHV